MIVRPYCTTFSRSRKVRESLLFCEKILQQGMHELVAPPNAFEQMTGTGILKERDQVPGKIAVLPEPETEPHMLETCL